MGWLEIAFYRREVVNKQFFSIWFFLAVVEKNRHENWLVFSFFSIFPSVLWKTVGKTKVLLFFIFCFSRQFRHSHRGKRHLFGAFLITTEKIPDFSHCFLTVEKMYFPLLYFGTAEKPFRVPYWATVGLRLSDRQEKFSWQFFGLFLTFFFFFGFLTVRKVKLFFGVSTVWKSQICCRGVCACLSSTMRFVVSFSSSNLIGPQWMHVF